MLSDVVAGSKNFFTATDVQSMKLYLFRPQEIVNMEQIERIFDELNVRGLTAVAPCRYVVMAQDRLRATRNM